MHGQTEITPKKSISPPGKFKLTVEAIDELDWFVARSGQMLTDALVTFQRMEAGPQLFYGLDFEIIFAYANPWSRKASQAKIVQYLVEQDRTPFVLLPGTLEELKTFIDFANRKKVESKRVIEALRTKGATKETMSAARSLCESASDPESTINLGEGASSRDVSLDQVAYAVIQAADRYVVALRRIDQLLRSGRHRELQSVFPDDTEEYWNEGCAVILADRMYRYRQDRHKNLPDARNLAVIAHHGNQESRKFARDQRKYLNTGVMLRLLTNTRCLFEIDMNPYYSDSFLQQVAQTDRNTRNEVAHPFALRNCVEAALAAAIQQQFEVDNHSACRNMASDYKYSILRLRGILNQIENQARNYYFRGDYDTERLKKAIEDISKLSEGQDAVEFLTDPWYSTMKHLFLDYDREFENKTCVGLLPAEFEPIDIDTRYISASISSDIRKSSLQKIACLSPDYTKSFLDMFNMDVHLNAVKAGGEELKTFVLTAPELPKGVYVARIDQFEDTWYAEWMSSLSIQEALVLVSSIFVEKSGSLSQAKYNGALFLNTCNALIDEEPVLDKLCALPLNSELSMAEYMELVQVLSKMRDVSNIEPIDIRCDTAICHLRIDIAPVSGRPGILFAFRDTKILPILIEVFQKTSPFGGCDLCIKKIKETVVQCGKQGGTSDGWAQSGLLLLSDG